jgi:hypothetical protein
MRYSLRTLVALTAAGPPVLAVIWFWGVPVLVVLSTLASFMFVATPTLLFPLAFPLALGWAFSLIAKLLIRIGTHPDNRQ